MTSNSSPYRFGILCSLSIAFSLSESIFKEFLRFFYVKTSHNSQKKNVSLKAGPNTENTDHGPYTGFYGPGVDQSDCRIL